MYLAQDYKKVNVKKGTHCAFRYDNTPTQSKLPAGNGVRAEPDELIVTQSGPTWGPQWRKGGKTLPSMLSLLRLAVNALVPLAGNLLCEFMRPADVLGVVILRWGLDLRGDGLLLEYERAPLALGTLYQLVCA